jgi:hypothetical protein
MAPWGGFKKTDKEVWDRVVRGSDFERWGVVWGRTMLLPEGGLAAGRGMEFLAKVGGDLLSREPGIRWSISHGANRSTNYYPPSSGSVIPFHLRWCTVDPNPHRIRADICTMERVGLHQRMNFE